VMLQAIFDPEGEGFHGASIVPSFPIARKKKRGPVSSALTRESETV
jgi:hypothetical protein